MIKSILQKLFNIKYHHCIYSYFIAAPKQNSSSYQEKQFDQQLNHFLQENELEITSITIQSIVTNQTEGLWIVAACRGLKKISNKKNLDLAKVEGLYHLDDELEIET